MALYCKVRVLCQSLAGNAVYVLTITSWADSRLESRNKKAVVVTARVHPGETNSSWIMEGFLDFLLGDSDDAQVLRDNFVFKVLIIDKIHCIGHVVFASEFNGGLSFCLLVLCISTQYIPIKYNLSSFMFGNFFCIFDCDHYMFYMFSSDAAGSANAEPRWCGGGQLPLLSGRKGPQQKLQDHAEGLLSLCVAHQKNGGKVREPTRDV